MTPAAAVVEWDRERASSLAEMVEAAMPAEGLSQDELLACCWDDPGVVLALEGGEGAVSAAIRRWGDYAIGYVKLLAVHPGARRLGFGRALLAAAESWLFDRGVAEVRWGASAPFYLWPGVDVRCTAALCLGEAQGYSVDGAEVNMSCPTTFRAKPPDGIAIRRALDDNDASRLGAYVREAWPHWCDELARGIDHGSAFGAYDDDGRAVGFACHSVNRAGWVGPMATRSSEQHRGVGAAMLGALCQDLMVAGHRDAEIAWVGPVGFYANTAGASVSSVFRTLVKRRPEEKG